MGQKSCHEWFSRMEKRQGQFGLLKNPTRKIKRKNKRDFEPENQKKLTNQILPEFPWLGGGQD